MSFASAKQIQNKLQAFLPSPDDFVTLEDYNKLYMKSLAVQTDKDGVSLPQKETLEAQHRDIVQNALKSRLSAMKNDRNKIKK